MVLPLISGAANIPLNEFFSLLQKASAIMEHMMFELTYATATPYKVTGLLVIKLLREISFLETATATASIRRKIIWTTKSIAK